MKPTKLLVESKAYNLLSSPLKKQLSNRTPLYKTFKFNDKQSIEVLKETRKLYSRGLIILSEVDASLVKSDIGNTGEYDGNKVKLDELYDFNFKDDPNTEKGKPFIPRSFKLGPQQITFFKKQGAKEGNGKLYIPTELMGDLDNRNSKIKRDLGFTFGSDKEAQQKSSGVIVALKNYFKKANTVNMNNARYYVMDDKQDDSYVFPNPYFMTEEENIENNSIDKPIDNPIDTITMDIPLFIRMLEYAREDAKTDMDLHDVTEKAISMGENGEILTMDNYEDIVGKELKESVYLYHKNPNTKQVTKYNFNIYEQKINMNRVRKLIYEALNKRPLKHNIETTIETEDGIEFEVSGYLYDEEGPVYDLKIVPNSYDEFDEEEIQKYFNSHQNQIENKLIEQYLQDQDIN